MALNVVTLLLILYHISQVIKPLSMLLNCENITHIPTLSNRNYYAKTFLRVKHKSPMQVCPYFIFHSRPARELQRQCGKYNYFITRNQKIKTLENNIVNLAP